MEMEWKDVVALEATGSGRLCMGIAGYLQCHRYESNMTVPFIVHVSYCT
jgi:hypothetical protein